LALKSAKFVHAAAELSSRRGPRAAATFPSSPRCSGRQRDAIVCRIIMPWRLVAAAALVACLALSAASGPASARSLFEMLFGGFARRAPPPEALPPAVHPRDQLRSAPGEPDVDRGWSERTAPRGRSASYCVRLCDGFYFPAQSANPSICASHCPATQTKLFFGGAIDGATAQDGTRYASLRTAYAYRDQLDPKCTCNGKTAFGLARIEPKDDPTLRPGDMIATEKGLVTFTGRSSADTAQFTPVHTLRADARRSETTGAAPEESNAPADRRRPRRSREPR
jgi:hypothetical protein